MILGTGIDLMDPDRIRRAAKKSEGRILHRLFTEGERTYCEARPDPWPSYAARFAAKEAFVKALGLGIRRGLSWRQVEVSNNELGRPTLDLQGRAAGICRERGVRSVQVSLSHQKGMAMAMVILEDDGP